MVVGSNPTPGAPTKYRQIKWYFCILKAKYGRFESEKSAIFSKLYTKLFLVSGRYSNSVFCLKDD
ncbi:MAG: hypothetical protein A2359_03655 [Candidatus Moranbacteria bacterium RIFOXYB1_FULL_43_19]|nr:MAG: hypothetical protein A2184_02170 [Candidatus Moranbacteria bacterium RIFOXYA1_FULL_44_7]OGI26741.1 MAG: hypothetical protein A2359_03655 [Candidatus Moranbacteria bacterium RIFOXYB1_FULL_43_19]OGI32496.1 MAG: hypothetical protein A2420_02870 [Candidatus Moranbacteria bacterium RIFOXYC1_FULL_44_13]OGI37625.1 MAG: hypothetical protein A2612_04340 [Candidatus Moranbacteria bacterium RIFOXYD1_FULL_44_12]